MPSHLSDKNKSVAKVGQPVILLVDEEVSIEILSKTSPQPPQWEVLEFTTQFP